MGKCLFDLMKLRAIIVFCYLLVALPAIHSQTATVIAAGPISYTNIDDTEPTIPVVDSYSGLDISDCTSIQISVEFEFGSDWPGTDNMESADQCPFGSPTCPGDPTDPIQGDCFECWDFMWIQLFIGGNQEEDFLLGVDTNTPQSGTYTSMEWCTDGETDADIIISNQNWAGDETNAYSNVTLICWEGVPSISTNSPLCAGQTLDLNGDAADVSVIDDWDWMNNGSGMIADPAAQNTTATDAEDGETYTLTVTDENNCTATAEEVIEVNAGFTATLDGTGMVCEEQCTDEDSHIMIGLSGGVEPYDVTIAVGGVPINIPGLNFDELTFQICHEFGGFLPDIDLNSDPIALTIPDIFWPIDVELISIEDDSGCSGVINGGQLSIETAPVPDIEDDVEPDPVCFDPTTGYDLTQHNFELLDGGSGVVIWLEDPDDFDSEIPDPETYDIADNPRVWAVVFDDPCYSDVVQLDFDIIERPVITPLTSDPLDRCGQEITLPLFSDLVDIENQNDPEYYLDAARTDGPFFPGDLITLPLGTSSIFIYDASGVDCDDQTSIVVNTFLEPEIISPRMPLSACGAIELPEPVIENESNTSYNYNTEPDGSGMAFFDGDEIQESQGINILFLIVENDEGNIICRDTAHIPLVFLGGMSFSANVPSQVCDTLFLPAITPPSPNVAYFTAPTGGFAFFPGDTITYLMTIMGMDTLDTLYLFDPTQMGACATIDTIEFEVGRTPILDVPFQTLFCNQGFLPPASANNPNLEYASDRAFQNILNPAIPIEQSTQVYFRDSIPFASGGACFAMDSFFLQVTPEPFAGQDSTVTICEGYNEPLNLVTILGNPDQGGVFTIMGNPVDFEILDSTMVDASILVEGSQEIVYSIEELGCLVNATITIEVSPAPSAGMTMDLTLCEDSGTITLSDQITDNDPIDKWIITGPLGNTILTSPIPEWTFTNLDAGEYTVSYELVSDPSLNCQEIEAEFSITILNDFNAGSDSNVTICTGQSVDITSFLSSDADGGGVFTQDGFPVMDPTNWTPATLNNEVMLQYILESDNTSCMSDTAFITVTISDNLSAGTPVSENRFCIGEGDLVLSDFIENESPGGTFYESDDLSTPFPEIAPFLPIDSYDFTYIVEGSTGCAPDTTEFTIDIIDHGVTTAFRFWNLCPGGCTIIDFQSHLPGTINLKVNEIGIGAENSTEFSLDIPGDLFRNIVRICNSQEFEGLNATSDTVFIGNFPEVNVEYVSFQDSFGLCDLVTFDRRQTHYNHRDIFMEIDTAVCRGEAVILGGEEFRVDTLISNNTVNGCDSIIDLKITFYDSAPTDLIQSLCAGQTFNEIPGFSFNVDIDTTIILEGEAAFGCDSTINLSLLFEDRAVGPLDLELCFGETETVDGVIFDSSVAGELVPFPGGSVFGCDSATLVSVIVFDEVLPGNLTNTICPEETFPFGDQVYDISNPSGPAVLAGAAEGGCDSIVNVSISFFPESYDLALELCANESIMIGDDLYDNTSSSATSSTNELSVNGCDSIVNVMLTIVDLPQRDINPVLCVDEDIIVNGVTYNLSNPTGQPIVPNNTGCDSLFNISIVDGSSPVTELNINLCMDIDTFINGTTYNSSNLMGSSILTNSLGCDSTVMVALEIADPSIDFITEACPGEATGTVIITDVAGLNLPLNLIIDGGPVMEVNLLPFDIAGIPTNTPSSFILDDGNCALSEDITIVSNNAPDIGITSTQLSDNSFELGTEGADIPSSFQWSPNDVLSCTDCPNPIATIIDTETISLSATIANGCVFTDSVILSVEAVPTDTTTIKVYIPNALALSETGENLFLIGSNLTDLNIDEILIFDRWGNKVHALENFPANDPNFAWDARMNGRLVEQGVYVYVIKYTDPNFGQIIEHGNLTVLR